MMENSAAGPLGEKRFTWLYGVVALVLYLALYLAAFPDFDVAEAAYIFAVPLLLWALLRPRVKPFVLSVQLASWLFWGILLIWLRHLHPPMGWVAVVLLSFLLACFTTTWFVAARWMLPRAIGQGFRLRLIALLGLSGFWVFLEWMKTWFFYGFPWATLSLTQWQRPPLLQVAEYTGHYGVSFILIFFNLALAGYFWRLFEPVLFPQPQAEAEPEPESEQPAVNTYRDDEADDETEDDEQFRPYRSLGRSLLHTRSRSNRPVTNAMSIGGAISYDRSLMQGFGRFFKVSPELYLALAMVLGSLWLFFISIPNRGETEPLMSAAVVQPWTDPHQKWDMDYFEENINTLSMLTARAAVTDPDVIVWPEAATPGPLINPEDPRMQAWVEQQVRSAGAPLLTGNMAIVGPDWYNAVFLIYPYTGTVDLFYAKQKRVPWGEFVPLRDVFPFIGKVVPVSDIAAGKESVVIPLELWNKRLKVGPLICYEDIFPKLGREMAANGADFLLVVTNDAWYGQEAGATQHAAHSVLRAVETRRPVLRCGNHGWSGWIDEHGRIRDVLTGIRGSIHFQGTGTFYMRRDARWAGRQTVYVKYGDWFVGVSALLFAWSAMRYRSLNATGKTA